MNVDEAQAQLALAKASEKYREAKAAYQADREKNDLKAAFIESRKALVAARDNWRANWRKSPAGPGDAVVSPAPAQATASSELS